MVAPPERRIGLVLSAGGLQGVSHFGVFRQLARYRIAIEVVVRTSVGALIAAYYAAVGKAVDEMMHEVDVFSGHHLLAHSLCCQSVEPAQDTVPSLDRRYFRATGSASQRRLGPAPPRVDGIGVVCHDLTNGCPHFVSTAGDGGLQRFDAVATNASVPSMFSLQPLECHGQVCRFTDGGLSEPPLVDFASHS